MIGQALSHFRITAKLGGGGTGEAYRVEDTRLGRKASSVARWALLLLLLCSTSSGASDDPGRELLQQAAQVIGAGDLHSIRYSGSGVTYWLGYSVIPGDPWSRAPGEPVRSTVTIDYDTGSRQRGVQLVRGRLAWDSRGGREWPADFAADERWLQIWVTPHGFVRAGLSSQSPLAIEHSDDGSTAVSFTLREKFRIKGWIDPEGQVKRVLTWVGDTDGLFGILGDMPVETLYSDYAEFDGLRFPRRIVQKWGGFPILELAIDTVQRNVPVDIEIPAAIRDGSAQPFPVAAVAEEVAKGVWHVTGTLWHSVAVEFDDHLVVVEAPFTAERSIAVLEELNVKAPGKPVKYVVNTHHHFDHSGGLRVYADRGAIILTHEINLEFFEQASTAPRRLAPDSLARSGRIADFRPVADKMVLSDGARDLELYHLKGSQHAAGLLLAYLPREKLLIEADVFDPVGPDPEPPPTPDPEATNLCENILHYGLDVETIVPIHGWPVPLSELRRWAGAEAVELKEQVD